MSAELSFAVTVFNVDANLERLDSLPIHDDAALLYLGTDLETATQSTILRRIVMMGEVARELLSDPVADAQDSYLQELNRRMAAEKKQERSRNRMRKIS